MPMALIPKGRACPPRAMGQGEALWGALGRAAQAPGGLGRDRLGPGAESGQGCPGNLGRSGQEEQQL